RFITNLKDRNEGRIRVMSLRVFHLIFISLSVVVCLFTGGWGYWASRTDGQTQFLVVAFCGFLGAIWLSYYGFRAYSKLFGHRGGHA
ncbi:MAG: hypothetical protein KC964_23385, partial [Candidatus Omnitrophica bacterium]|nr:hypothetical protein [Candidatus Omnitrophota bacterium]